MKNKKASGILLHITSLPSEYGVGDLGPKAYEFADFLARAKQSYWQILPITPPSVDSPYNCLSAFAGNTLLISPQLLYRDGFVSKKDLKIVPAFNSDDVDYSQAIPYKTKLLNIAYENFKGLKSACDYEQFCDRQSGWLDSYTLFMALRDHFGCLWHDWPEEFRDRQAKAIEFAKSQLLSAVEREKFFQYLFFRQWADLKNYCNSINVKIIGDIPIYVSYDSADVWAWPQFFKLKKTKKPSFISGTPPDYFSSTGQLWGNPIYDWSVLKKTNYSWWIDRIRHDLTLFDVVRIDHFRAFIAYWQVNAENKTAAKGRWVKGPGKNFLKRLFNLFPSCPLIAEDLGYITRPVKRLMEEFDLPGMKVLQYGFDEDPEKNPHWVKNHIKNSVVYTGTHDNNTIKGWFTKQAQPQQKKRLYDYLGEKVSASQINWKLIELAFSSRANLAIIPAQDILNLDQNCRMNLPGTTDGNWCWRVKPRQITPRIEKKLLKLTRNYRRIRR